MALDSDNLDELLDVLPDDMDEFLDRLGSKAPQPKSAAQVRSIVDEIKAPRPRADRRNNCFRGLSGDRCIAASPLPPSAAKTSGVGNFVDCKYQEEQSWNSDLTFISSDLNRLCHSYALLPIGYPMGRFEPVRRVPLPEGVFGDQWGQPYRDQVLPR